MGRNVRRVHTLVSFKFFQVLPLKILSMLMIHNDR